MKIQLTARNAYNKINEYGKAKRPAKASAAAEGAAAAKAENIDQIEISASGARQMEVDQLARSVAAKVCEPASPQKIESLRQAVADGTYHVSTDDLVEAMIRHWRIA